MKEKILIIEDYSPANQKQTEEYLDQLLLTEELDLTILWKFYQRKIDQKLLSEIAGLIRQKGRHREFSVLMVIETDQWKEIRKLRNVLNQYGFTVELAVSASLRPKTVLWLQKRMLLEHVIVASSDYQTLRNISDPYWKAGVPVVIKNGNLNKKQYMDWFDQWIQTCDGGWIDLFVDAVSCLYTGIHTFDCRHDSCLGKYLYLDAQGIPYFCAEKKAESRMQDGITQTIYDALYMETLTKSVEKRKHCAKDCTGFGCCQGGCPLAADSGESCKEYLEKLDYIRDYIFTHKEHMFSRVPNPALRQMLLNVAAFGFCMESKG